MNVVYCSKSCPKLTSASVHTHPYWEIVLNCDGEAKTTIADKVYDVKKGTITVIPPNTEHSLESDTYFEDIYFAVKKTEFLRTGIFYDSDGSVLAMMNTLHKVMTENGSGYRAVADSIAATICRYISYMDAQNSGYAFLNELKNVMYDNIDNSDFNLSEAIMKTGYNADYVRRLFRKEFATSPLEYLTRLRISQAKSLLVQTDFTSIADVAYHCGFSDPLYFSTCFKKHEGIAPLEFRKNYYNI